MGIAPMSKFVASSVLYIYRRVFTQCANIADSVCTRRRSKSVQT